MVNPTWSIGIGFLIFLIIIPIAIAYYLNYKKVFLVFYLTSIATYLFGVVFTWDVFELNKNYVLLMFFVTTLIMIALGRYFSKMKLKLKPTGK